MEKEIKDLTLQRDIAQTQVKEMQQMLGDDASLLMQVHMLPRLLICVYVFTLSMLKALCTTGWFWKLPKSACAEITRL